MTLNYPHCRFNQLTREWALVSPHHAKRPWLVKRGLAQTHQDKARRYLEAGCRLDRCAGAGRRPMTDHSFHGQQG